MKKALIIIGMYLAVGTMEANAKCNPYTYVNCSGAELRAVAQVQFEERNQLRQHVSKAEKLERVVTGKPTVRWETRYDNTYTIVFRDGFWIQELRK